MMNRDERAMDVLDRAIIELRGAPVPDGPPPHLVTSTIKTLQPLARPQTDRVIQRRKHMLRIARYSGIAATIAFLAILGGWLVLMDRTASVAFADVVKNINDAKSVTFVTKMPTVVQGTKSGVLQQKMYIQGDAYRMEIPSAQESALAPVGAPPIVVVLIADWKEKKALLLDYTTKTAKKIAADEKTWDEMAKSMADPIKQLRLLKEKDAERLGDEELDGRKTTVYRLKRTDIFMGLTRSKDETAKLWVDPKSGLPVRIAVGDPSDTDKPFIVFEQFNWNVVLDPDLFKLEAPKGFTLKSE
jgi:outer membrane lipoprotein-sorting protein